MFYNNKKIVHCDNFKYTENPCKSCDLTTGTIENTDEETLCPGGQCDGDGTCVGKTQTNNFVPYI